MRKPKDARRKSQFIPPKLRRIAVAYLRRSTEKQEASIEQQRAAIKKYADEKGYVIVREYVDDGISGDSTDQREAFRQMIADATALGDFQAIICWDQKRFGRFDSVEYGYWVFPLKQSGIILALVNGGVIDWNDNTARIVAGVTQEGAYKDLTDLAAGVARGMQLSLDNGSWVGSVPYAYRLDGPKHHKLLVLDDPFKAQVVKRVFGEYVAGKSKPAIAAGLDADHIANPSGRVHVTEGPPAWRESTIKVLLENPAYVGDFRGRQYVHAKYNTRGPAGIEKPGKRRRRPASEWVILRDRHEAIIDRDTFNAAQERLGEGKKGRSSHYPDDEHPFILHGLLRCGRCGCDLWGMRGNNGPTAGRARYYECSNRKYNGKDACEGTTVREDRVMNSVAEYLMDEYFLSLDGVQLSELAESGELNPSDLPTAFAKVRALIAPPRQPAADRKKMEKQAKDIEAKIEQARRNLAYVSDPENAAAVEDEIRKMKVTRDELQAELRKRPPSDEEVNAETLEVLGALLRMASYFLAAAEDGETPEEMRPFLRKVAGITAFTRIEGQGTRRRHHLERGEIVFRTVGLDNRSLNPHVAG
jgi:DNA invertase Pin-like site-specific DNA recombinase